MNLKKVIKNIPSLCSDFAGNRETGLSQGDFRRKPRHPLHNPPIPHIFCQTSHMRHLTVSILVTLAVLLGIAGVYWSAEPDKGFCLAGTIHSHAAEMGKCSDAYESGNYKTALQEWKPLAEKGNTPAQFNLGQMYNRGQGVPQNDKTAVKWYTLAAEQGNATAQYNLGVMYDEGHGVLQDYKTAVKWYTLSAEQGYSYAQSNLGLMYAKGQGVQQDYVRAHMWFNIAATYGDSKNASKNRDIVTKRMTPSQIDPAQKLARECVAKNYKEC